MFQIKVFVIFKLLKFNIDIVELKCKLKVMMMLLTWMMTPTIHWQDMTMMAPGHSSVGTLTPYLIKSVIQIFSIFYFITGCPGIISLSFSSFLSKGGMSIRVVFDQKPFCSKTFPCLSKIFRKWTLNLLPHLLK